MSDYQDDNVLASKLCSQRDSEDMQLEVLEVLELEELVDEADGGIEENLDAVVDSESLTLAPPLPPLPTAPVVQVSDVDSADDTSHAQVDAIPKVADGVVEAKTAAVADEVVSALVASPKPVRNFTRAIRILVSAVVTFCLVAVYVCLDKFAILPGALWDIGTYSNCEADGYMHPKRLKASDKANVTSLANVPIDATAAQATLSKLVDDATQNSRNSNAVSALIADMSGNVVSSINVDKAFTPASTMKTVTAYAVSAQLDPMATLATRVYAVRYSTDKSSATLVLQGGGDVLLGEGESDPDHITGRAGLETLVRSTVQGLSERGIKTVDVAFDDSLFAYDSLPATMSSSTGINAGYGNLMEISSMAIDEARVSAGRNASNPDELTPLRERYAYPATHTAQVFLNKLRAHGVEVANDTPTRTGDYDKSVPVAHVESAHLYELVALMLTNSDNTLALTLARLLALHRKDANTLAGSVMAVLSTLRENGISTDKAVMADPSGLAPGSQLTARTLLDVQKAYMSLDFTAVPAIGMPVSRLSGTLRNRNFAASAGGLIRAKSGSHDAVASLVGLVNRRNGGGLIFVVMVNGDDTPNAVEAINTFASSLVDL